ncbi:hypothetical protein [Streptomyces griseiscabiei]|uniref:Uncharacterized protein n=1 Tax=Streptomyces griseiscabiei TaxID=2993540 RepID=A0ABU4LDT9_9ACTN|nr:hypothetical protein [Streptomyces griseiscabiei]MDX2913193.1 hypothetical protein [Streptomyces griseiscabiei]
MSDVHDVGAIVTGGAGGIGAATAALPRERGARVAVLDLRTDGAPAGVHALPCASPTRQRSTKPSPPPRVRWAHSTCR